MKTHVRRSLVPGIALSLTVKVTRMCSNSNILDPCNPINGIVTPRMRKIALSDSVATCIGKLIQLAFGGDRAFDRLMVLGCFMTWGGLNLA